MTTFRTSRDIPASPEQVFAAIADPERLARWWGPAGFSNTFGVCEFKPARQSQVACWHLKYPTYRAEPSDRSKSGAARVRFAPA